MPPSSPPTSFPAADKLVREDLQIIAELLDFTAPVGGRRGGLKQRGKNLLRQIFRPILRFLFRPQIELNHFVLLLAERVIELEHKIETLAKK